MIKKCKDCGREFVSKRSRHYFCCYKCCWRFKNKKRKRDRGRGGVYQHKFPKQPCEYCGLKDLRAIHRHHVNKEVSKDNIMYLCANCHQILHIELRKQDVEVNTKEDVICFLRDACVEGIDRALS